MVIKDPAVWEDDRIVLFVGNKAIFKYVHQEGPILSALHIYDHMVDSQAPLTLDLNILFTGK